METITCHELIAYSTAVCCGQCHEDGDEGFEEYGEGRVYGCCAVLSVLGSMSASSRADLFQRACAWREKKDD